MPKQYQTRLEVLNALRLAPKGLQRAEILSVAANRRLVLNSGAEVTLYSGTATTGKTVKSKLQNINLGLISRLNAKTGAPDGIGALGGLSERTSAETFNLLSENERQNLLTKHDDIILINGRAVLTDDMNIIRQNNVLRETREELGNLGIYDYVLQAEQMQLVDMEDVKDDNYIINIWNGNGEAWAVTPYCHILATTSKTLDKLVEQSKNLSRREQHSEAANFIKLPLFEALKRYGQPGAEFKLEDGRNAISDYRYPHSWLTAWFIAAEALHHNDNALLKLMQELQAETLYKISFKSAAAQMGKELNFVAKVLKIQPATIEAMEKINPHPLPTINIDKIFR